MATDLMKTTNKLIIGLLVLGLAGLFTIINSPAQQGNQRQPAATVIIQGNFRYGPMPDRPGNFIDIGMGVKWIERSSAAPAIEITTDTSLAEVMAFYQNQGFEMTLTGLQWIILNRPAR
jgi:hypothetical protein